MCLLPGLSDQTLAETTDYVMKRHDRLPRLGADSPGGCPFVAGSSARSRRARDLGHPGGWLIRQGGGSFPAVRDFRPGEPGRTAVGHGLAERGH